MLAFVLAAVISEVALGLRLVRIDVPTGIIRGDPIWLNCTFDLENDELYSVKWYKGTVEFYRYLPSDNPPGQKYDLPGVHVELAKSHLGNVFLKRSDLTTEGLYRCEVSAEAPSFQTERAEKEIRVYVLPEEGPLITGTKPQYQVGDNVNVTCTSAPSKPAPILKWFINGKQAAHDYYTRQKTSSRGDGLKSSTLHLRFVARPEHFWNGSMKLRCTAAISQSYTLSSEEIIIGSNARAQGLHGGPASDGPTITGGQSKYNLGDVVSINCTSGKANPPAELKWHINDREARPEFLQHYAPYTYLNGQTTTVLGLIFVVQPEHFFKQEMRLKCTATVSRVINMSSEETAIGSYQQTSGLHVSENTVRSCCSGPSNCIVWPLIVLTFFLVW